MDQPAWLRVLEPMEQAVAELLARTVPPAPDDPATGVSNDPGLRGAVPLLDEVLAPVEGRLAEAEQLSRSADALLEESSSALTRWNGRLAELARRLAETTGGAV